MTTDPTRSPRVLVVDDEHLNRRIVSLLLQRIGCETRTANDGEQALAAIQEDCPDLVFMDVWMPGMDGLETTRALRALDLPRQPYVVALTGSLYEEDKASCLAAGMDAFLEKPATDAALRATIQAFQEGGPRQGKS